MKSCDGLLRGALEVVELAGLGRGHDQRPGLDADDVVGRHHAGAGVAGDLLAVDESEAGVAAAELQHQPPPGALDLLVLQAAGATQDRRHLGQRGAIALGSAARLEHRACARAAAAASARRHHLDHALVGLARARAEGEDAVLVEDQALDLGSASKTSAAALARPKPGRW